ncbi:hypothetical protein [Pseudomonas viciae]|uniref:hypothetical protein n=1 Tax=Pseudomonas viciae TaxID=2505979 RepID=UPI002234DE3F|nr:hypothetical protein [Pseudomonas viciae]UZE86448.1 hypothetical protein LOY66_28665 [Pseudomonas viciae]
MPAWAGGAHWSVPVRQLLFLAGGQHDRLQFVDQGSDLFDTYRQMHLRGADRQLGQKVHAFDQHGRIARAYSFGHHIAEGFVTSGQFQDFAVDNVPAGLANDCVERIEVQGRIHFLEGPAQEHGGNFRGGGACE